MTKRKHVFEVGCLCGAASVIALIACGPPPAPAVPAAPSSTPPVASASAPRAPGYQRDRDALSASFDRETNPFTKLILAKIWVAVAKVEAGVETPRVRAAQESLQESEARVAGITEACAKEAQAALEWAAATKQSLERRYLSSVDLLGEQNIGTKVVDAEVVVLRDEIEVLERRLKTCPKQYYGPGDR